MAGKRVLVRLDLNVPVADGRVSDETRIRAVLPSIKAIMSQGARQLIMLSHLGRPDPARPPAEQPQFSLAVVARQLEQCLGVPVSLITDLKQTVAAKDKYILLENTRFLPGETSNDAQLAQQLADLGDVFVMDAFACAHRAHASTYGVAERVPERCAGLLIQQELAALSLALENPARPLAVIMGGAKVEDKLQVLKELASLADLLIVGGGIANTFLAARGLPVGKSLYDGSYQDAAREIMKQVKVPLPVDLAVTKSLEGERSRVEKAADSIAVDEMIVDIGSRTQDMYHNYLRDMRTIIWNGPLGVFEQPAYQDGTQALARSIADSTAYSLAGGGDTIAAINKFIDAGSINYVSTGGGAFLEYIEKRHLPSLRLLD